MKLKYKQQITNHHCVPASISMLVEYIDGRVLSQRYLGKLMGTTSRGTWDSDLRSGLRELGFSLKSVSRKAAKLKLGRKTPLILIFQDSPTSYHCAVATSLKHLRKFDEDMVVILDPFYGPDFRLPFCSLKLVRGKFFELKRRSM